MEDSLDYISARVMGWGFLGGALGTMHGVFRGHHNLVKTGGMTALSFALVATVCFGTERLAHAAIPRLDNRKLDMLCSHGVSGAVSGYILGGIYLKKPLRGVFAFIPGMIMVALAEDAFIRLKERKQQEAKDEAEENAL